MSQTAFRGQQDQNVHLESQLAATSANASKATNECHTLNLKFGSITNLYDGCLVRAETVEHAIYGCDGNLKMVEKNLVECLIMTAATKD
jgi:hypothetical protein